MSLSRLLRVRYYAPDLETLMPIVDRIVESRRRMREAMKRIRYTGCEISFDSPLTFDP